MVDAIIVCAPRFDDVTEYCFEESRDLINFAEHEGVKIIDLPDEKAVRAKLEEAIVLHPGALIYHTDHGSEDKAWGDDEKPVLDLENVDLLRDREAYMNNCSSAKKLGVEAYKHGCKAYWGSKDVVSFTTDAWEDFKEAFLHGLKLRIQGCSWSDCFSKTREKLDELVDKLLAEGKILAASCMRSFRDTLVCYTPETPPAPEDTECPVRRLAIRVFGPKLGWKLRKKHIVISFAAVASILAYALGFNTIEYMCHYAPPERWCFIWPNKLCMPFWYAYFFGGILPLTTGSFLAGLIVGMVTCLKLLKRKTV